MKFLSFRLFWFALLCLNTAAAQSIHTPLRKGDWAYDREQYQAAEKQYRIAADRDMGNPQAVYNLGNTLYQQGNFEDAEKRFQQAVNNAKTPAHRADALHNLGDAFLKQRKYKEALGAYEASLRLRPADAGTKQNLQMAKKRLQEEEKKEKEQKQKQQQQQEQNQGQNQDPQQDPKDQPDKEQNQPSQPQPNQQAQPQQPKSEQQKKQEEQRLKKEDAKRLLETAVGPDDRKNAQKYRAAQQQSKPKTSKKDW